MRCLASMHDSKPGAAKFTAHFNGNTKNTIRFIFAIQQFNTVSRFMDPDSLFHAVYNNIADSIKIRFATDKATVIAQQAAALPDDPSQIQLDQAAMYSAKSMQKFFIKHYRPSITRGNIFRQLLDIRMRYNESPREVLDRAVVAIGYAQSTIELYNEDAAIKMARLGSSDKTLILTNIFCSKNNSTREKNNGGINALVQKVVRDGELQYKTATKYVPWYTAIDGVVNKISSVHYSGDERYRYVHHEPQILELWDQPKSKPRRPTNKPTKRRNPYQRSPYQPPTKNPRQNPNYPRRPTRPAQPTNPNTNNAPPTCFRCGKIGHKAIDCYSKADINRQPLHDNARRQLNQMPYRGDYNKPSNQQYKAPYRPRRPPRKNPRSFPTKNNPRAPQRPNNPNNPWPTYPRNTSNRPPSNTSYTNTSSTNNSYNNPIRRPQPHPNPNPNPNQQPQINALLAQLQATAEQDTHIDPSILQQINTISSLINPDNSASGHHPQ